MGLQMKYFVLNPLKSNIYGHSSRIALRAYARSIRRENPTLADDLIEWLGDIEYSTKIRKLEGRHVKR